MMLKRLRLLAWCIAVAGLTVHGAVRSANADAFTWRTTSGASNVAWTTGTNWVGGSAPNAATANDFYFVGSGTSSMFPTPGTGSNYQFSSITFTGTTRYTIGSTSVSGNQNALSGSGGSITVSTTTPQYFNSGTSIGGSIFSYNPSTISVQSGGNLYIGSLAGSGTDNKGSVTFSGDGTLTIGRNLANASPAVDKYASFGFGFTQNSGTVVLLESGTNSVGTYTMNGGRLTFGSGSAGNLNYFLPKSLTMSNGATAEILGTDGAPMSGNVTQNAGTTLTVGAAVQILSSNSYVNHGAVLNIPTGFYQTSDAVFESATVSIGSYNAYLDAANYMTLSGTTQLNLSYDTTLAGTDPNHDGGNYGGAISTSGIMDIGNNTRLQLTLEGNDAWAVGVDYPMAYSWGGLFTGTLAGVTSVGTGDYAGLTWSFQNGVWSSSNLGGLQSANHFEIRSGTTAVIYAGEPNTVTGLYATVVSVPEPAQMVYVAGMAVVFGAWRLRSRRLARERGATSG